MTLSKKLALNAIISQIAYLLDIVSIEEVKQEIDKQFKPRRKK